MVQTIPRSTSISPRSVGLEVPFLLLSGGVDHAIDSRVPPQAGFACVGRSEIESGSFSANPTVLFLLPGHVLEQRKHRPLRVGDNRKPADILHRRRRQVKPCPQGFGLVGDGITV
jgi:hypothetical protein